MSSLADGSSPPAARRLAGFAFVGLAANLAHGVGFLALAVIAYIHFGELYLVPSLVMAGASLVSLQEAGRKLRALHGR